MSNRPAKPAAMSWVIPYLMVESSEKAVAFYRDVLGLEVLSEAKNDDGMVFHAELQYKDVVLMCGNAGYWGDDAKTPAQGNYMSPVSLYLYVEDVDAFHNKVKAAGANVLSEPEDQFWGDRMFRVADIDGHQWTFATNVADHG